jgi:uncharacterized membrane protein
MSDYPVTVRPANARIRTLVLVVDILYAANLFVWFTSIVGVVIAYMKRGDAAGTIYESHMTYAIRTFWIGLALDPAPRPQSVRRSGAAERNGKPA